MERLAKDVVGGTDYRVYRIFPDFAYDKKKAVVGLWSHQQNTRCASVYAQLWDPFGYCGLENKDPASFSSNLTTT